MKKYIILSLAMAFALVSCEDEPVVYNSNDLSQSLVSFASSTLNIPVEQGSASNSETVTINVSTVSNVDRTFGLTVIDSLTTAPASYYSFPNSVTIPAGSYNANVTITGNEDPTLTVDGESLTIGIVEEQGLVFDTKNIAVSLFLTCPVPTDFLVGSYDVIALTNRSANAFAASGFVTNVTGPEGLGSTAIEILNGETDQERTFQGKLFVRASSNTRTVRLSLICGKVNLARRTSVGFTNFFFDPSANPTSYDLNDDSEIIVNYIDNPEGAFGGPTDNNASFLLRKR